MNSNIDVRAVDGVTFAVNNIEYQWLLDVCSELSFFSNILHKSMWKVERELYKKAEKAYKKAHKKDPLVRWYQYYGLLCFVVNELNGSHKYSVKHCRDYLNQVKKDIPKFVRILNVKPLQPK